jgi:hypothetical protein
LGRLTFALNQPSLIQCTGTHLAEGQNIFDRWGLR